MPAKEIVGSLDQALTTLMNNPSNACEVYYLKAACKVPYTPDSIDNANCKVTVFDKNAKYVGVAMMDTGSVTELLVSDAFGPCVPVIAIGDRGTSLAHFNGLTDALVTEISINCQADRYSTILVIQRESPDKHVQVSNTLFKMFDGFKKPGSRLCVELVKVPLTVEMGNSRMAVMVIGSSVLVYPSLS